MRFYLSVICSWFLLVTQEVESCSKKALDGPKTSAELQEAIKKAASGSTIELLPIDYKGDFVLQTRNAEDSVTLKGNEDPSDSSIHTKIFGSATALSVQKGVWTITSLIVESGNIGVSLKGPKNVLNAVSIRNVRSGVEITGDGNTVDSCKITATSSGLTVQGSDSVIKSVSLTGSGITISSGQNNHLKTISISGISQGSTGLEISGDSNNNRLDTVSSEGLVNIKGNSNTFHIFRAEGPVNFFGCGNRLEISSLQAFYSAPTCTTPNNMGSSNSIKNVQQSPIV